MRTKKIFMNDYEILVKIVTYPSDKSKEELKKEILKVLAENCIDPDYVVLDITKVGEWL